MSMGIIAGVVGAGASIYSASQAGSGGGSAPLQLSPKQQMMSYLKGLQGGLPGFLSLEQSYRPQFGQLNNSDVLGMLMGYNGQPGVIGMGGQAAAASADQLQQARQKDYANMLGNTSSILEILGAIDPAGKQQAAQATTLANDAYNRAMGPLTFQEQRANDQASREAFGSRGRINDNASIADEILGRENVKAAKRQEASQLGAQAFALNQQFNSPVMQLLQGVPASVAMGQDYLSTSLGAIGANGPQLLNPDAAFNIGAQTNANLASYNTAQAAQAAGQASMWGQVGSSLMGLAGDLYKNR